MSAHEATDPSLPAHESVRPGEAKKRHVRYDKTGGSLSPRGWAVLLGTFVATIISAGGYTGLRLVTAGDVDAAIEKKAAAVKVIEVARNVTVNKRLDGHDSAIKGFTAQIGKLAKSQHREEASQEAHRLTEGIRDRTRREREYERLRARNKDRLGIGKPPCYNLDCTN